MPDISYRCEPCDHIWESWYQFNSKAPSKEPCPKCKKEDDVYKRITGVPAFRDGFDHHTKGGREANIYRDLNKKYKNMAGSVNKRTGAK